MTATQRAARRQNLAQYQPDFTIAKAPKMRRPLTLWDKALLGTGVVGFLFFMAVVVPACVRGVVR